ncbi:MAG: glycosyltransferase family 4 protein [Armatimonadota bacterium]
MQKDNKPRDYINKQPTVALLLGTMAHRRITNTFKGIEPRYNAYVVSAQNTYPTGGDLGFPEKKCTTLSDITKHIPKIRHNISWDLKHYTFGIESALADADAVISHSIDALYAYQATLYCEKREIPSIIQEVTLIPLLHLGSRYYKYREKTISSAKYIIAVTERAKITLELEGVPSDKIRVVPFGIDTEMFNPNVSTVGVRESLGLSEEDIVVLYVGNIHWEKGLYDLLNAAKLLSDDPTVKKRRLRFVLFGSTGAASEELRKRISYFGLSEQFILPGAIDYDKLPPIYASSDMVVLASIPGKVVLESAPLVLLEAMASGVPVIGTYCGGIPEILGNDGILVQPADTISLRDAIKQLAIDSEYRRELGSAGLARIKRLHDSRIVSAQYADILDEARS